MNHSILHNDDIDDKLRNFTLLTPSVSEPNVAVVVTPSCRERIDSRKNGSIAPFKVPIPKFMQNDRNCAVDQSAKQKKLPHLAVPADTVTDQSQQSLLLAKQNISSERSVEYDDNLVLPSNHKISESSLPTDNESAGIAGDVLHQYQNGNEQNERNKDLSNISSHPDFSNHHERENCDMELAIRLSQESQDEFLQREKRELDRALSLSQQSLEHERESLRDEERELERALLLSLHFSEGELFAANHHSQQSEIRGGEECALGNFTSPWMESSRNSSEFFEFG